MKKLGWLHLDSNRGGGNSFLWESSYRTVLYCYYLFLAVLHLLCRLFSGSGGQGLFSSWGMQAFHCSGFSLQSMGSRAHGLSSYGMWCAGLVVLCLGRRFWNTGPLGESSKHWFSFAPSECSPIGCKYCTTGIAWQWVWWESRTTADKFLS